MRISDWSSDVCSSDLLSGHPGALRDPAALTAVGPRFLGALLVRGVGLRPDGVEVVADLKSVGLRHLQEGADAALITERQCADLTNLPFYQMLLQVDRPAEDSAGDRKSTRLNSSH